MNNQPQWIKGELDQSEINDIATYGCASGTYMPAVTYWQAIETMSEHGDEIFEFIEEALGEIPMPASGSLWGQMCCHYVSTAVELWCMSQSED